MALKSEGRNVNFVTTRKEFTLSDDSGYRFHVVLVKDDEYGWGASVSFSADGYAIEQAALDSLAVSVERFLGMLKDAGGR